MVATVLIAISLAACAAQGPQRLQSERFNYNEAISTSGKEQMLGNVVRFRYLDFPVFMSVNSVITTYSFEGEVGVSGTNVTPSVDTIGAEANLAYSERPTITYAPLSGPEFTRRILAPIPLASIFALGQTGWDIEVLLRTAINRINDVENIFFEVTSFNHLEQSLAHAEQLKQFNRVIELMVWLAQREIIVLQRPQDDSALPLLVFDSSVTGEAKASVMELKTLLELDQNRSVFRVTTRLMQRQPNEIAIHTRSLLAIMSFLSKGVEIPQAHTADGWVEQLPESGTEDTQIVLPLRVRSQSERPGNAFAAVQYQGYWFYVDQADLGSKAVFQMLLALFELQAPAGGQVAPLLTLPAGG